MNILVGSLSPSVLAGAATVSMLKFIPGLGQIAGSITQPVIASAFSYAVGNVTIAHLESGGDLDDFDAGEQKARFRQLFQEGKEKLSKKMEKQGEEVGDDQTTRL